MKKFFVPVLLGLSAQFFVSCSPEGDKTNMTLSSNDTSAIMQWIETTNNIKLNNKGIITDREKIMLAPGPTEPYKKVIANNFIQYYHNHPLPNLGYTSYLIKVSEIQKILSITEDTPDYLHIMFARKTNTANGDITLVIAGVNSAKQKHVYFKQGADDMVLENVDPCSGNYTQSCTVHGTTLQVPCKLE